jgi:hypothetical protein
VADDQLKTLVPLQFDELRPFQNQLAVARKGNKYGMIRPNGKEAIPFQFDSLLHQKNFLLAGNRHSGKMGWSVYDTFGVCKTSKAYEHLGFFNGKYFPVSNYGFQGGVDRYGKEILSCVYDSLLEYNHSQVAVKFKGQYGILDFNEKWLALPQSKKVQLVNDQSFIELHDTIRFLKSFDGETIYFTTNKLAVKENYLEEIRLDGATKKISFDGVELTTFPFMSEETEKVFEESEGYRGILRDGRYGFIDGRNRLRVANRYEAIGKFREDLAPVRIMGRWGFVSKEDKIIINPSYERVEEFQEGVSIVKRNGKMGFIDKQGNVLLATRYDSIFRTGRMLVIVDHQKKGLADKKGTVLIEPRFDELELLSNDRVLTKSGQLWGVLTYDGLSIIPPIYDTLVYQPSTQTFLAQQRSPWVAWAKP